MLQSQLLGSNNPDAPRRALRRRDDSLLCAASALAVGCAVLAASAANAQEAATAPAMVQLPTIELNGGSRDSLQPMGGQLTQPTSLVSQITQSATVVDRAEIEQTSPVGMLDVLADVPGVSIARSGGIGGQIYLRGFSSNNFRSPLYVDGNRFRGRNTLQLNYFSPEEIDHIEVIRGPASVLYGSEALTGLVNIVTRSPTGDPNGPFRFTGGGWSTGFGTAARSFSTDEWVQGAGHGFDMLANIAGRWGNDYDTPKGSAPNSDYRSLGGSVKLGYTPTPGQRFELAFRKYTETDGRAGGVGGAPGWPYLNVRQSPNDVTMGSLTYTGEFDGLVKRVEGSFYINYFDTYLKTINNTINASGVTTRTVNSTSHVIGPTVIGGRLRGEIPWSIGLGTAKTTIGVDSFYEDRPGSKNWSQTYAFTTAGALSRITTANPATTGPDTTQTNLGAYVLHEWTPIERLTLSAGGRFDWFETTTGLSPLPAAVLPAFLGRTDTTSTAPTGSVGIVYQLLPTVDLIATVATSFRQPTNSELYAFSATTIPNPSLKPERGVTYEGGFRFHLDNATLKVTAFDSHYENFLQTTAATFNGLSGFTQSQNIGRAVVRGVEVEGRWQVTETTNIFGSAAYLHGDNKTTHTPLPYIAPFLGRVGVQYAATDASYSVMGVLDFSARKSRIDPGQEYPTAAYAIPKLYATLQLGKLISPALGDTRLILGIENIFNQAYRQPSTFANVSYPETLTNPLLEPGRNFTFKLQHTF